jgi:hypothetical protein
MGEEEDTLGEQIHRELGERGGDCWRVPVEGRERASVEGRNNREEERGLRWPNHYSQKGVSLVVTLLCYKGGSDVSALRLHHPT